MSADASLSAFAVAPPGFSGVLDAELRGLDLTVTESGPEGVSFEGGWQDVWCANLSSRVAVRILLRVARFEARRFGELERHLSKIPWGEWVPPGDSLRPRIAARKSRLLHTGKIAEILSQAAGRSLAKGEGTEGISDIFVRLAHDRVTVSVDTSGELLHRRGYRRLAGPAPLRENLAAACLLALGYDGSEPLWDPCCGSGTFPVEAALLALRIPPGAFRSFAFQRFAGYDCQAWEALRDQALAGRRKALSEPVFASDIDSEAVRLTAASVKEAGFSQEVQVAVGDVRDMEPPAGKGLLVANPPYGVRLGGGGVARALSRLLATRFAAWRFGVILPEATAFAGSSPGEDLPFRSGGLALALRRGGGVSLPGSPVRNGKNAY